MGSSRQNREIFCSVDSLYIISFTTREDSCTMIRCLPSQPNNTSFFIIRKQWVRMHTLTSLGNCNHKTTTFIERECYSREWKPVLGQHRWIPSFAAHWKGQKCTLFYLRTWSAPKDACFSLDKFICCALERTETYPVLSSYLVCAKGRLFLIGQGDYHLAIIYWTFFISVPRWLSCIELACCFRCALKLNWSVRCVRKVYKQRFTSAAVCGQYVQRQRSSPTGAEDATGVTLVWRRQCVPACVMTFGEYQPRIKHDIDWDHEE